jgi:ABC-type bacteriocin/lantibiotic exporter with double-glycine peptidase domain
MTSVAMAMNGLGKKINGAAVTPKNLNQFLLANGGYQGNLYVWGAISRFGFKYQGQPTNINTIKNYVCSKAVVILNIDKGGHWVLATGVNGNTFTINDPGRTRSTVSASEVSRAGVYTY